MISSCGGRVKLIFGRAIFLFAVLAGISGLTGSQQKPTPPAQKQTQRIPQFDNEDVRVWRSVIAPNAPLTMHRHEHPRVIVALNGGTIKIVEDNGKSEAHVWETGKAYWLPANAPNTVHADVNQGDQPIEVMVVELKHEK
jgi:quercetin dioxygenase-like cupin family protein